MKNIFGLFALLALFIGKAHGATLDVRGGVLFGAMGVNVEGAFYDVEFFDSTCAAVFDGCDDVSDFDFSTAAGGLAAAQALIDQVLVDPFANLTAPTFGCGSERCVTLLPFAFGVSDTIRTAAAANDAISDNAVRLSTTPLSADTSSLDFINYARFTPVAPVPLPASGLALLAGLVALVYRRRRTRLT